MRPLVRRFALQVFWHSSAHILGEALESCFSAQLTHGPALDTGFFYDSYLGACEIHVRCTRDAREVHARFT